MTDRPDDPPKSLAELLSDLVHERYGLLSLLAVVGFMLWVRLQSYDRFVRDDGVYFSGNDAYYHYREVSYVVQNWPTTMPFDPWTNFPTGANPQHFGTLFDQIVATAALIVGLGSPSEGTVALTLLVAPAAFGAAVAVPTYLLCRRLGGRVAAIFGIVVLALLPGAFLQRSVVGFADHHVAEVLFQTGAILAMMVAVAMAEREKPVYELVVDRDRDALRRPVGWSALAGFALALYVWTWPPAILLVGIFGTFFLVKILTDYLHGRSPEPIAFVGAVSMGVAGLLSLVPFQIVDFSPTSYGMLQPLTALGVGVGCVFLAWLAREWDDRELDRELYPAAVGGLVVVSVGLVAVVLPSVFGTFTRNFQRILGFSSGAETRTIGEAQPFLSRVDPQFGITATDVVVQEYGLMFFTAMLALVYLLARPLFTSRDRTDQAVLIGGVAVVAVVWQFEVGSALLGVVPLGVAPVNVETALVAAVALAATLRADHDGEHLLVAVWALFVVAAAFTQLRFNYYLAVVVVALNAYAMGEVIDLLGFSNVDLSGEQTIEPYQVMALMLAVLVVVPVLVAPVAYAQQGNQQRTTSTAWEYGNRTSPGEVTGWAGTLTWMRDNTPEEGTFATTDGEPMAYYGTYRPTDDYEYPPGAYGVMSWWDYGHWITVYGERIPTANPFQQGATHAANFLLAPNESRANEVLASQGDPHEETRYVLVDHQMVDPRSKFSAPTVFYTDENVSFAGDFVSEPLYQPVQGGQGYRPVAQLNQQRYYESQMVRLFRFHGSYVPAGGTGGPVTVVDWDVRQVSDGQGGTEEIRVIEGQDAVRQFDTVEQAREFVEEDGSAQIGGFGGRPPEDVPALQHYRLVRVSEEQRGGTSFVKAFERVDGATVEGAGPPNTNVSATVELHAPTTNETFTYTQWAETGDDGTFEMTLPYSTTGYESWGPDEGYTNVSVRATGEYRFTTGTEYDEDENVYYVNVANASVTEAQVIGEDDGPVTVELEREVVLEPDTNESDGNGNETVGNETVGNETADNETDGIGTVENGSDGESTDEPRVLGAPARSGADGGPGAAQIPASGATGDGRSEPARSGATLPRAGLLALVAGALLVEVRDP